MKTTLPVTKARQQFFKLIEAAEKPGHRFTITVEGEPKVILMSYEDFEGWMETLEIMSDKDLMQGLQEAMQDVKKGRLHSAEEVRKKLNL